MSVRVRNWLSLLANVLVLAQVTYASIRFFMVGGWGNMQVSGVASFRYFTEDSNLLAAVAGLCIIPFAIQAIRTGKDAIPGWVLVLKFAGTVSVAVTFVVAATILLPAVGVERIYGGNNFFMHGVNPLLCIISFVLLERGPVRARTIWLAMVPTAVYAVVYYVMVVVIGEANGGWPDFYSFTAVAHWPVLALGIVALSGGLAALLRLSHRPGRGFAASRQ